LLPRSTMGISRSPEHRLDSFIGDATAYTRTIDTTEDILALTGQITKFLRHRGSSKSKQWDLPSKVASSGRLHGATKTRKINI
jgi:phage-related protein